VANVVEGLIAKLNVHFFEQSVLDVMGIVYPQYWLQENVKVTFPQHLENLKGFYYSL
jgi:hypothetical protein